MTEPGGFNFDELREMLERLGKMASGESFNLDALLKRLEGFASQGFIGFASEQNPDASWLTTITAAKHATTEAAPDPAVSAEQRQAVNEADRLAQSWLDEFTVFTASGLPARALTRVEWLEDTSSGWRSVVEPIIVGHGEALSRNADTGDEDAPDLKAMMAPIMRQSATLMYRNRLKDALSKVALDTLTGTEIGFSLSASAHPVILPANVSSFTSDLDASDTDLLLVLMLREAARQRLFHNVGWLAPQLIALLSHYAREITIDLDAIAQRYSPENVESLTMEDLSKLSEEVEVSFFRPASTPEQIAVLERIGVLLSLVEGWVDHVTARTMEKWMPHAPQLAEVLRRRRAAGSPVRVVLRELIGLEYPAANMLAAERLWAVIEHERGISGRDDVWSHPDLIPGTKHLDDPHSYLSVDPKPDDELDEELRKLLDS